MGTYEAENCLRDSIHVAFGVPMSRIPARPTEPPADWDIEFLRGLRRNGLDLQLVGTSDLDVRPDEEWVCLTYNGDSEHALAMRGAKILHDPSGRRQPGTRFNSRAVAGLVRRRWPTDKWGRKVA